MPLGALENKILAAAWSQLPNNGGDKQGLSSDVAAEGLLSSNRDYYRFNGSLTPPSFTEGVRWLVMKEPVDCGEAIKDDDLAERVGFEPTWGIYAPIRFRVGAVVTASVPLREMGVRRTRQGDTLYRITAPCQHSRFRRRSKPAIPQSGAPAIARRRAFPRSAAAVARCWNSAD